MVSSGLDNELIIKNLPYALSLDSRNFPVANLPCYRFREINLSWNFPVLQYYLHVLTCFHVSKCTRGLKMTFCCSIEYEGIHILYFIEWFILFDVLHVCREEKIVFVWVFLCVSAMSVGSRVLNERNVLFWYFYLRKIQVKLSVLTIHYCS